MILNKETITSDNEYISALKMLIGEEDCVSKSNLLEITNYLNEVTHQFIIQIKSDKLYNLMINTDYNNAITYFNSLFDNFISYLPTNIPNIYNKCFILNYFLNRLDDNEDKSLYILLTSYLLKHYIKSYNELLILVYYNNSNDCNLNKFTKFKSFSRAIRKLIIDVLNDLCAKELFNHSCLADTMEDVLSYKNVWLRLGEVLHPGEFKIFSLTYEFFNILRNKCKSIKTFNSKLNSYYNQQQYDKYINYLSTKPIEFCRQLNWLLDSNIPNKLILSELPNIIYYLDTKYIIKLIYYFSNKNLGSNTIYLYIKDLLVAGLINKFESLPYLGDTFIDNNLSKYILRPENCYNMVPDRIYYKGSKITLNLKVPTNSDNINSGLDLSIVELTSNLTLINKKTTFNIKTIEDYNSYIKQVEINARKILNKKTQYIIIQLNNFSCHSCKNIQLSCYNNFFIYSSKVTINTAYTFPVLIDIKNHFIYSLNLESLLPISYYKDNSSYILQAIKNIVNYNYITLYNLFFWHSLARSSNIYTDTTLDVTYDTIFIANQDPLNYINIGNSSTIVKYSDKNTINNNFLI